MAKHEGRKHSKFSASGAERYFECPGSVALSEGRPDKSSPWAEEGTKAHEVLEELMKNAINKRIKQIGFVKMSNDIPEIMVHHGTNAANFMLNIHHDNRDSDILFETRIALDFIHPEMFGTFDGAVIDYFDTLHVFDYKYGIGYVSAEHNLQMIFYGLGLAHKYDWNFKRVRLWIIQPRLPNYDGPTFWDISIEELRSYVKTFKDAVQRVVDNPTLYIEGSWCHWCKAKSVCPLKRETKLDTAKRVFTTHDESRQHGKQKESNKKGKDKKEESPKEENPRRKSAAQKGKAEKDQDFF